MSSKIKVLVAQVVLTSSALLAAERQMTISTVPSGATVELGGAEIGTTPLIMSFPTAYFQPPNTVWARHLGAPLQLTFSLPGYATKTVAIGDGPRSWTSINGASPNLRGAR